MMLKQLAYLRPF